MLALGGGQSLMSEVPLYHIGAADGGGGALGRERVERLRLSFSRSLSRSLCVCFSFSLSLSSLFFHPPRLVPGEKMIFHNYQHSCHMQHQ